MSNCLIDPIAAPCDRLNIDMGIKSFWKVLDAVKESKSLLELAAEHRQRAQSEGISGRDATLTLGVDMGACMAECNAGALAAGVHTQQAGGGLYIFFKKLTKFAKAPVALIFVFNGTERPPVKRGHEVRHQPIWWTELATELIEIFGYQIHQAPGEAEAELAKLNTQGHIHAVITSDGDAFLFGTQRLLRSIPKNDRKYPDEYSLYSANEPGFPLTQGGMLIYALLCGGDYNQGVAGCGPTTAVALARCGFGDQLLAAYYNRHSADFSRFLAKWRHDIWIELMTNFSHFLTRRRLDVAGEIVYDFPDRRVLEFYANLVTSWSPGRIPPDPSRWQFKQPSIPAITQFCTEHFQWTPQMIKKNFKTNLWEGVFLQMLYSPFAVYDAEEGRLQLPGSIHADILNLSHQKRRGQFMRLFGAEPQPKLVVSVADFINSMGSRFRGNASGRVTIWPPASLLPKSLSKSLEQKKSRCTRQKNNSSTTLHPVPAVADSLERKWVQTGENSWFIDLT